MAPYGTGAGGGLADHYSRDRGDIMKNLLLCFAVGIVLLMPVLARADTVEERRQYTLLKNDRDVQETRKWVRQGYFKLVEDDEAYPLLITHRFILLPLKRQAYMAVTMCRAQNKILGTEDEPDAIDRTCILTSNPAWEENTIGQVTDNVVTWESGYYTSRGGV